MCVCVVCVYLIHVCVSLFTTPPQIPKDSPATARDVMKLCFLDDPSGRPSFTELLKSVEKLPIGIDRRLRFSRF